MLLDDHIQLQPGDRVLDAGTGTGSYTPQIPKSRIQITDTVSLGSWILTLSKRVPETVELVGIDLSLVMFPNEHPKNVKAYEKSVTNLPVEWSNYFSLVSQRLLFTAFTEEMRRDTLSEYFRVLRPGGTIQLMEIGRLATLDSSLDLPATKKARDMVIAIGAKRGVLGADCIRGLPELLTELGFTDAKIETHHAPLGKQWGENGVRGLRNCEIFLRAIGAACMADGGLGVCGSQTEVDETVDRATREWDENPGVFIEFHTVIAKKPIDTIQ